MACSAFPFRLAIALLALAPLACQSGTEPPEADVSASPAVANVRTTDYAFHAPSELRSGWTTFRMTNEGVEPHFLVLWLLPEDKTFDDYIAEVVDPFMELFNGYKAGEMGRDEMLEGLGGALPEWLDLRGMGRGGVGLLSPGRTAETTVELAPGTYVMECYMVAPDGQVHNQLGMLRPLIVTDEPTGAVPPEAAVEMEISNQALVVNGELAAGRQTVKVTVTEEPGGLLGHDVHLARLDDTSSIDQIATWMDWVDGLTPPAPAEFLGGAEQVPPGHASYITIDLEPGRYLWISEAYGVTGLRQEFVVE